MSGSRVVLTALASGLLLSSAGMAFAASHHGNEHYQMFVAGKITGTAITIPPSAAASTAPVANPFALDGGGPGTSVNASLAAKPSDDTTSRISPDPFH